MIRLVTSNVINGRFNDHEKIFTIEDKILNKENENSIILHFKTNEKIESSIMLSSKGNYCCASIINDFNNLSQEKINKEFIFLVDCSGSMNGLSIKNAGKCLEIFIRSLPKNAFFNIIRFGTNFTSLYPHPKKYNEQSRNEAVTLARSISADLGGTDIYSPLSEIFKTIPACGQRCIFILTDGEVTSREQIINLVENNSKKNTCFTLGLGDGCDGGLLEKIAEVSGGKCDFVDDDDSISEKVVPQLFASIYGFMQNFDIHCEGENNDSFKVVPYPIPQVCLNNAIQVFIQGQENSFKNGILVTAQYNDIPVEIPISKVIQLDDIEEDEYGNSGGVNIGQAIFPLFSFELLKKYEYMGSISKKDKEMATKISISSGVLCRYTGFFGMSDTNINSSRKLEKRGSGQRKFVTIDGKKIRFTNISTAKTGKHGHARSFIDAVDEKTGKTYQVVAKSSEIKIEVEDDGSSFDLISLLDHQDFEGYWDDLKAVNEIAGINIDNIDKIKLDDEDLKNNCIATIIAIAILHVLASDQINSWKIIEEKGIQWLKSTLKDVNVDDLIIEIEQLILKK